MVLVSVCVREVVVMSRLSSGFEKSGRVTRWETRSRRLGSDSFVQQQHNGDIGDLR